MNSAAESTANDPVPAGNPPQFEGTVSQQWAKFIAATNFDSLPPTVIEQAKARILDCLSTAIAARDVPVPTVARKFVSGNTGKATVIASRMRLPAIDAAFVNAVQVNGTTHDDFLVKSHAGAVVVPASLAIAEEEAGEGKEILASVVVGYELAARTYLGGPAMLPQFRASGVAGTIGATAAAGKLQKLSLEELVNALGCSALFASGFGEGFLTGTMDVKLNVGWACRSGISASSLARAGATASPTEYEGKSGFYNAFARSTEFVGEATRGLGEKYLIEDVSYKERPVCYFVQTPVHLAYSFAQMHKVDVNKIEHVSIGAPEATYTNPGFNNTAPYSSPLQARISAKFTVAAALLGRPIHEYSYYANMTDADVLALAEKIHLSSTPDHERVFMEIVYDGKTHDLHGTEAETLRPTTDKIITKFMRIAGDFLGSRSEEVLDLVLNLERLQDIRQLTNLLQSYE